MTTTCPRHRTRAVHWLAVVWENLDLGWKIGSLIPLVRRVRELETRTSEQDADIKILLGTIERLTRDMNLVPVLRSMEAKLDKAIGASAKPRLEVVPDDTL